MKGHPKILNQLQELLNLKLSARDQYLAHSRLYLDWGLHKLHAQMEHEMEEEQVHVDAIMNRMLFLEGCPDLAAKTAPKVGKNVPEMIQNDLDAEIEVAELLRKTIQTCEELKDYETRNILQVLLHDTEMDHIYTLEQQINLIKMVGLENFLQTQM